MLIEATFIGQASLGYKRYQKYRLSVSFHDPKSGISVSIIRTHNGKEEKASECPYESVEAFFKNWTSIRTDYL